MKKIMTTLVLTLLIWGLQAQDLPRPSPMSSTTQKIGASEVTVEYYRPGVKGRTIFGDLVPFDEIWRFGANGCTQFTTSDDLMFGGETLAAGSYCLFAIPGENGVWEIAFNTDTDQSGTANYTAEKDVFRLIAVAQPSTFTETFTLGFDYIRENSAHFVMTWENTKVVLPFMVNTAKVAEANITEAIATGENLDQVYSNAANYYYGTGDNDKALKMVEKSVKMEENYRNVFMKARIMGEMGKKTEAVTLAKKALKLAEEAEHKGYVNFIKGTIEEWTKK